MRERECREVRWEEKRKRPSSGLSEGKMSCARVDSLLDQRNHSGLLQADLKCIQ